ncbi:hypothetical protein EMIHUDRAFT_256845 [Emiliania huxleyi CCMP1516]|uniref:Peptidase S59 domain-containing protein n=2 Tax=Emiliania huxleyi TaxID=2903 RepID=A0A0D3IQ37_EMIH1|nr:hypothetical protein EMIHUDRAFT_256845 [Emiliania huxleyi CCMP1516]EOD13372.1 hypothetical protein EMIHUDRAFT_256845 [Emiliania huxleyi CCMP1516]|eukprot:XP_005765801.1 hypothetical protein EMIHUDRAFT_256845 [Emiliania huxleyi CCMP1516]
MPRASPPDAADLPAPLREEISRHLQQQADAEAAATSKKRARPGDGAENDERLAAVEDFELSCPGLGSLVWPGVTDLRGLPGKLDGVVKFGSHEVLLYPDLPEALKPRPGEALNKRFIYTMENVWARDKRTGSYLTDARSVAAFRAQLQRKADKLGIRMLSYSHERGLWRVEVVPS